MDYRPRRLFSVLALCCTCFTSHAELHDPPLKFGITAVILQDQSEFLAQWETHLESRLGRDVEFVQRGSYAEISELLSRDEIDIAWVCGAPYVRHRDRWRLVAVPLADGKPTYQSYLIVRASDTRRHDYADLQGIVFAYSDPDSNSGYLVPQFEMLKQGFRSASLFRKTFFTWSHHDTVRAVAVGLAQAGAVDGYIWETLARIEPELTRETRVAAKSDWYGFPPIAARASLAAGELEAIRRIFVTMDDSDEGRRLLGRMNLDGFVPGEDAWYDRIQQIIRFVDGQYAQGPQLQVQDSPRVHRRHPADRNRARLDDRGANVRLRTLRPPRERRGPRSGARQRARGPHSKGRGVAGVPKYPGTRLRGGRDVRPAGRGRRGCAGTRVGSCSSSRER